MESIKQGSTSVDYSKFSDQVLADREGKLERQKNSIENPLSSWTIVHKTDSMSETVVKIALAVITLGLSMGIPTLLEFLFHEVDKEALNKVDSEINAVYLVRLQRSIDSAGKTNQASSSSPTQLNELPKPSFDRVEARAKMVRRQIDKGVLSGINSQDFKKLLMPIVKDDILASMITALILGAPSIQVAIDIVEASKALNKEQLKDVEKVLDKVTAPKFDSEFAELVEHHGLDFARRVFPNRTA